MQIFIFFRKIYPCYVQTQSPYLRLGVRHKYQETIVTQQLGSDFSTVQQSHLFAVASIRSRPPGPIHVLRLLSGPIHVFSLKLLSYKIVCKCYITINNINDLMKMKSSRSSKFLFLILCQDEISLGLPVPWVELSLSY